MSHGLPPYRDSNDPQNGPAFEEEWPDEDFDDSDAEAEARESARQHHLDWIAEHVG